MDNLWSVVVNAQDIYTSGKIQIFLSKEIFDLLTFIYEFSEAGVHQFHYHNWKTRLVGVIHSHKPNNMRVFNTTAAKTLTYKTVLDFLLLFTNT